MSTETFIVRIHRLIKAVYQQSILFAFHLQCV